ncbi:hypothetical protein [Microbulbifer sp. ZKSA002]|uniref:hypothetical protein n=1 Tax=Microbulbifer sp. ZKSA002 TaxID=3243388 RepID=UPI0040396CB2
MEKAACKGLRLAIFQIEQIKAISSSITQNDMKSRITPKVLFESADAYDDGSAEENVNRGEKGLSLRPTKKRTGNPCLEIG